MRARHAKIRRDSSHFAPAAKRRRVLQETASLAPRRHRPFQASPRFPNAQEYCVAIWRTRMV